MILQYYYICINNYRYIVGVELIIYVNYLNQFFIRVKFCLRSKMTRLYNQNYIKYKEEYFAGEHTENNKV